MARQKLVEFDLTRKVAFAESLKAEAARGLDICGDGRQVGNLSRKVAFAAHPTYWSNGKLDFDFPVSKYQLCLEVEG